MTFQLKWLISNTNSRELENLVGKSSTINYHIQRKPFNGILDSEYSFYTYRIKGAKHKQSTRRWIQTIINHLDPIINVDFQHVKNAKKAHLIFLSVKSVSEPWDQATLGENVWNPSGGPDSKGAAYVLTKQSKSPSKQMEAITHELGHALGLKHPKQKPYSPEFSKAITAMSYNSTKTGNFLYKDFTINDLKALAKIWGREKPAAFDIQTRIPFPGDEPCAKQDSRWEDGFSTNQSPKRFASLKSDYLVSDKSATGDNMYGKDGDDTIIGSSNNDTIGGGPGNDLLDGGNGSDQLYGHDGKDRFQIKEGEGVDHIHSFEQGKDMIQIKHNGGQLTLKTDNNKATILLNESPIAVIKEISNQHGSCNGELQIFNNSLIA